MTDGTLLDATSQSGVDLLEDSFGALLTDLDNDGDADLVVVTDPWVQFAENDGNGRFELREQFLASTDAYSLCAADFDNDRDLDVYICGYNRIDRRFRILGNRRPATDNSPKDRVMTCQLLPIAAL